MTQSSIQSPVTIQELLISSLAQTDALAKLLTSKFDDLFDALRYCKGRIQRDDVIEVFGKSGLGIDHGPGLGSYSPD